MSKAEESEGRKTPRGGVLRKGQIKELSKGDERGETVKGVQEAEREGVEGHR